MAATPEEALGFVRPAPATPSVFFDLPLIPHQQPAQSLHVALDSISRMLMEEDIVEKIMYQYPDNPILLQAQQPFTQILSAASGITSSSDGLESSAPTMLSSALPHSLSQDITMKSSTHLWNADLSSSLNGTDIAEPNSIEGNTGMQMLSTIAFLKGMEEARLFLPTRDNEKSAMISVQNESEKQATAGNMLDELMLEGHGLCFPRVWSPPLGMTTRWPSMPSVAINPLATHKALAAVGEFGVISQSVQSL